MRCVYDKDGSFSATAPGQDWAEAGEFIAVSDVRLLFVNFYVIIGWLVRGWAVTSQTGQV